LFNQELHQDKSQFLKHKSAVEVEKFRFRTPLWLYRADLQINIRLTSYTDFDARQRCALFRSQGTEVDSGRSGVFQQESE